MQERASASTQGADHSGVRGIRSLFGRTVDGKLDERELRRVERLVQRLRWLAIGSWIWLIQGATSGAPPAIVYGAYAVSLLYAAGCDVLVRRTSRIRATAILTTLGDTFAVTLMCSVTGGIHSPAFPVFFLSVLATTIRFGVAEAFLIASFDTLHAIVLYFAVGGARPFDLLEYVFYVYFVALLGGLLSAEARRQHARAVKEKERAALLLTLNREIVASSDLRELLSRMLRETLRVVSGSGACVVLRAPDGGADSITAAGRIEAPTREEAERLLRSAIVAQAHAEGRVELAGPEVAARGGDWLARLGSPAVVIAGIRGAEPLGVLILASEPGSPAPSEEEAGLVSAVAEEVAVAIQKARLGADLVAAESRSRELLHRVIDAEEAERRRIAGELHDRMGKRFFEFYYDARLLQGMSIDRDSASSDVLARIIDSARECAGEIRTLMNDLRPSVLDDFGFLEALKEFVTGIAARGDLELTLSVDESAPSAGPEGDLMLFRVVQEAVFNARKHAEAKHVRVEFGLTEGRRLRLLVHDDGRGFDQDVRNPGHYGLLFMKERAEACGAEFEVRSVPREGTEIEVRIAVPA